MVPNKSVGELCFGMTKAETRAVMNYELRDTKQFDEDSDRYMDLNIRLDFDDDDRLEAVEFLGLEEGFYDRHWSVNFRNILSSLKNHHFQKIRPSVLGLLSRSSNRLL